MHLALHWYHFCYKLVLLNCLCKYRQMLKALGTEYIGACWGVLCDCPQDHSRACNPTLEQLVGDLAPDLPWGFVSFGGSCPQA